MTARTLGEGRYRLERELGRGGMATVRLARDLELDRPVAVKLLGSHLTGDEDFRRRFVREARMAARLSHPNVVQVYDAGEEDGRPYIVMEYVPGTTLAARLAGSDRTPPETAAELGLQACAGLAHAHAAGLVHRDVKPANLLLRDDGVLKVADFGIARAAESTQPTRTGSILGSAAYLAPEQATGGPVTGAADLYGLGVVLYELLTGRPPRSFASLAELATAWDRSVTPVQELAPAVPAPLAETVMRCLAREPERRPASAAALARGLAAGSVPPPAGGETRVTEVLAKPAPARRPRRALVAAIAGSAALALAAAGGMWAVSAGGAPVEEQEPRPRPVEPVPAPEDPAEQARSLASWLREHGG